MRLVFAGTPEVSLPSLDALLASRHDVVAVVTRPDARAGRGRALRPSPVKERALEAGVEVLTPPTARDPEFLDRLVAIAPDAVPVVAYGNLVPKAALDVPRHGWINLHFSLLPAWRGAAPVQHSLIAGETRTGACTFVLEEGLDTGPILQTLTADVAPGETAGELLGRLAVEGAHLLGTTIDALEDGSVTPTPQVGTPTLAPKLTREDGRLRWEDSAARLLDRWRGCTPAPGSWTVYDGAPLKILELAAASADAEPLDPGVVHAGRRAVHVGTGDRPLELVRVQPQGKKRMAAADWARGARSDGARFDDE